MNDGRLVRVERKVDWTFRISSGDAASGFALFKNWPDKFWLQFKHPDTQETIKWQGEQHFRPVLLDVIHGVPYLVVYGRTTKETESTYGCPELPYIYLRYDPKSRGKWIVIQHDGAPAVLKRANLSPDFPDIGKKHLTVEDVERLMYRPEDASSNFFQRSIPRTYEEWRYAYKSNYLNERKQGDCRPPRIQSPTVFLPPPLAGSAELLETVKYIPNRVHTSDDWARLFFDQKREGECKRLFRPADPNDYMQDQRFVHDSTESKRVPYSKNGQFQMGTRILCDKFIWFVTHQEERGKMIITQFTITGDLAFRISFPQPEPIQGYVGYVSIPSLRSEAGFLYFDWMDFREINREWHVGRVLKMRIRESAFQK